MDSRNEHLLRPIAFLVALAVTAVTSFGSTAAPPRPEGPQLKFAELVHDFGPINDARPLECEFPFENTGDAELVISGVKPSCGCTTTELAKDRFAPGESSAIDVEWEPKGFGKQSKTINVRSNDPANPYIQLTIKAEIEPLVQLTPPRADFGDARALQEHVIDVVAKRNDPGVRILEASSSSPFVIPNVVVDDEGNTVLRVVLSDRAPKGRFYASIKVHVGGTPAGATEPVRYELSLPVAATLFQFIRPDPPAFFVGRVDPGGKVRNAIRLVHVDGAPFQVVAADVTSASVEGLSVHAEPFSEGAVQGIELVLEGSVGEYLGLLRGRVEVMTDIADEGPLEFDVMGMVRAENEHDR